MGGMEFDNQKVDVTIGEVSYISERIDMPLKPPSQVKEVHGLTPDEKSNIKSYLQGAVYCWIKDRPNEWFAGRTLVGGTSRNWTGTPLAVLFDKHIQAGKSSEEAVIVAGQDLGRILKAVLSDDKRTFETEQAEMVRQYRWIGGEI